MFSTLLRRPRPRQPKRRVSGSTNRHSPSFNLTPNRRPPLRFAEGDDDQEEDGDDQDNLHAGPSVRHGGGGDDDDDGVQDDDEQAQDEDGPRGALPVLPLFSATHLGTSINICSYQALGYLVAAIGILWIPY